MEPKQKIGLALILGAITAYALTRNPKKQKLEQYAQEEKQTAKTYKKEGHEKQAQQEKEHSQFFEQKAKQTKPEKGKWFEKMKALKEAKKLIRMTAKEVNKGFKWVFK